MNRSPPQRALLIFTFFFFFLFLFEKKKEKKKNDPKAPGRSPEEVASSARQADFSRKQQPHYCEEDGEHEEHVGRAHHRVVGQLVRLTAHFVNVEADGEDECRHAEQDHYGEERGEKDRLEP